MVEKVKWRGPEFFKAVNKHIQKNLKKAVIFLQKEAKRNVYGPSGMRRGTGALQRSIQWEVSGWRARYGSNLEYARIHETGRPVIKPRKGKYLSIPLTRKAKSVNSPLDMPDLEFIPLRGRNPILATVDENFNITEVHWVLVESVTMPPRPYLRPALDNNRSQVRRFLTKPLPRSKRK